MVLPVIALGHFTLLFSVYYTPLTHNAVVGFSNHVTWPTEGSRRLVALECLISQHLHYITGLSFDNPLAKGQAMKRLVANSMFD